AVRMNNEPGPFGCILSVNRYLKFDTERIEVFHEDRIFRSKGNCDSVSMLTQNSSARFDTHCEFIMVNHLDCLLVTARRKPVPLYRLLDLLLVEDINPKHPLLSRHTGNWDARWA